MLTPHYMIESRDILILKIKTNKMKTKAEQLINDLYVTFQNDNTLKQVRINIVLQFARETAEKAYPEMPGWGF